MKHRFIPAALMILIAIAAVSFFLFDSDDDDDDSGDPIAEAMLRDYRQFLENYNSPAIANATGNPISEKAEQDQRELFLELTQAERSFAPPAQPVSAGYASEDSRDSKVILFGIDGATWKILMPLIATGVLPNFANLLKRSSYGLLATDEANSPISWTSIASGKGRAKAFFFESKIEHWDSAPENVRAKRLWDILTPRDGAGLCLASYYFLPRQALYPKARIKEMVLNPLALPAEPKCSQAYPAPVENPCLLLDMETFGKDPGCRQNYSIISETDVKQHLLFFYYSLRRLQDGGSGLILENPSYAMQFEGVDKLVELYKSVDKLLGRVADANPDAFLFVVSDHGFKSTEPKIYLEPDDQFLIDSGINADSLPLPEGGTVKVMGSKCKVITKWQGYAFPFIRHSDGRSLDLRVYLRRYEFVFDSGGDARSFARGVNREIDRVSEDGIEYFQVVREGERVALSMPYRIAAAFSASGELRSLRPLKTWTEFAMHNADDPGIFIAAGPGIAKGRQVKGASLFDITPTILYLKDREVAEDLDGKVLTEMIDPSVLAKRPIRKIPTYGEMPFIENPSALHRELSTEEREHLKGLGYIQ